MSQYFNLQHFPNSGRGASKEDSPVYPVDGSKGWLVVLGSFLAHLSVLGLLYAFGIFVIPLTAEFGATRAEVSLIGTLNSGIFYFGGIFSGPLADKFGVRPIMTIGAVIWVIGCMLASITNALWQQIITQGIMVGFGTAFVYWPAISVVPQWFDKYRGTAVGLAALGAGVGNLVFALGGTEIIAALGWRNTLRVLGGVGGVLLFISICLMKRRVPTLSKGGLFGTSRKLIKLRSYQWFLFSTFLFQFGFLVPFVHLGAYSNDLGIDTTMQGLALAMLGVGSSIGRVLTGPIADRIGRLLTFRGSVFLASVTLALWSVCTIVPTILTFAFFYGFFAGGFIAQAPVVAGDLWGVANLGGTFALVNLVMIPGGLSCGPIAGLIFETYGTYLGAILGSAGFLFAAAVGLCMVKKEKVDVNANSTKPSSSANMVVETPAESVSLDSAGNPLFKQ